MADTKISQLPAATTPLSGAEVVPLVQSGATVQTPVNEINKLITETASTFSAVQTFTASPIISVTDNTNAALRVTQLGTGLALRIEDSTNPDSTPVVVDASGQMGVGTTTLNQLFQVGGTDDQFGAGVSGTVTTAYFGNPSNLTGGIFRIRYDRTSGDAIFTTGSVPSPVDALTLTTTGSFLVTGPGGLGYGTGSGGAVTQLTSRTTGVTLNKTNGSITLFNAANSTAFRSFTVTNSTVAATDVILLSQKSGTNIQQLIVSNVAAGSFEISHATTTGSTTEAPVINFAVIKAVTS